MKDLTNLVIPDEEINTEAEKTSNSSLKFLNKILKFKSFEKQSTTAAYIGITNAAFSLLIVLSLIFLSIGYSNYKNIKEKQLELLNLSTQLEFECKQLNQLACSYVGSGDSKYYNEFEKIIDDKTRENLVDQIKKYELSDDEMKKLEQVINISNVLVGYEKSAFSYLGSNLMSELASDKLYQSSLMDSLALIETRIDEFNSAISESTNKKVSTASIIMIIIILLSIIIAIASLLISLLNMLITKHKVISPIERLSKEINILSEGKLSEEMKSVKDQSEIGMLAYEMDKTRIFLSDYINEISNLLTQISNKNLNLLVSSNYIGDFIPIKTALINIIQALNNIVIEILNTAEGVTIGATELTSGARQLSERAVTQAAATERLMYNIKDIAEQAENTKISSIRAKTFTEKTKADVFNGQEKMGKMSHSIEDIKKSSEAISGIIKTIDDIAFETNLLAINASSEAAKVGAAGKGFALIAGEVRNLADKSATAAKDSEKIISNTLVTVASGMKIVNEAVTEFNNIVNEVESIADIMSQIANASSNQANAASKITDDVSRIADVAIQNSATAEESYAAGENLLEQATALHKLVEEFKLQDNLFN